MKFLSFGAGVQTTAMLLMYDYDEVIFADTGSEKDQTYEYIEKYVKPYCRQQGIKFTTVYKMVHFLGKMWVPDTLGEWCRRHHNVPSIKYRWSTRDWKLRPICRYIRSLKLLGEVVCEIGISADEEWRVNEVSFVDEPYVKRFPLAKAGMRREDCVNAILSHGWKVPPKSGCYFCHFQTIPQWNWLYLHDPQKYESAKFLENNCRVRHPYVRLNAGAKDLDALVQKFTFQMTDFPFEEPITSSCDTGYCNR